MQAANWSPSTPDEREYYDKLFQIAGASNMGRLTGQPAVNFLARSGLPFDTLKQSSASCPVSFETAALLAKRVESRIFWSEVWDIAGDPKRNYLRCEDFYVAMRLISMAQASPGKPISAERLKKECTVALPFARMQGLPPPPTGAVSKGMIARTGDNAIPFENVRPGDPYAMSAQERLKYERLFPVYDTDGDGFLTGPETVDLFSKSGLPREHLRQIWELSDADGDRKLSMSEFCVGMHLIVCVSKKGLGVPATLPRSLVKSGDGAGPSGSSSQARRGLPMVSVPPSQMVQPSISITVPYEFSSELPSGNVHNKAGVGDAFSGSTIVGPIRSHLAMNLPRSYPTPSLGVEAEAFTSLSSDNPPQTLESALQASQPQDILDLVSSDKVATLDSSEIASSLHSDAGIQGISSALTAHTAFTPGASAVESQMIEQLREEKVFLGNVVEADKVEVMKSEQELRQTSAEVEALKAELHELRTQFQQQLQESIKLRARVTEAAVERAALLAEINACKASLDAQQGENAFLLREEAMIDGTRDALKNYRVSIQKAKTSSEADPPNRRPTDEVSSSADQFAEQLRVSPLPINSGVHDVESKVEKEIALEPVMPSQTPPPPPSSKDPMPQPMPQHIEDPFAEMVGKQDSDNADSNSSAQSGMQQNEEKSQSGFDAFPPVGDGFESDPFAMNGFGDGFSAGNAAGGAGVPVVDDPFSATDDVFTNATAAAGDGFDAFPPSATSHFPISMDAFGQNT